VIENLDPFEGDKPPPFELAVKGPLRVNPEQVVEGLTMMNGCGKKLKMM
jgi:hypothetical protein